MKPQGSSRREFLKNVGVIAAAGLAGRGNGRLGDILDLPKTCEANVSQAERGAADYTLRIGAAAVEIGKKQIVSAITYNGQFPGPLLRFKEGQPVVVDVRSEEHTSELQSLA